MSDEYFVVEFRLPVQINEAESPENATKQAREQIEKTYGINLSAWYARVYLYRPEEIEPIEFFYGPGGTVLRDKNQNIGPHESLIDADTNQSKIKRQPDR